MMTSGIRFSSGSMTSEPGKETTVVDSKGTFHFQYRIREAYDDTPRLCKQLYTKLPYFSNVPVRESVLSSAVDTYNEYRGSMATATVLGRSEDSFLVRFEGPFTRMCCDYDYVEDLLYELDDCGADIDPLTVASIDRVGPDAYVAEFAHTGDHRGRT